MINKKADAYNEWIGYVDLRWDKEYDEKKLSKEIFDALKWDLINKQPHILVFVNDDKNYDNTIAVYGVAVPGDKFDNTPMVYGVVEPYNNESITVDNSSSFINKSKSMFDDIIKKDKEKAQEEIDGLKSYLGIDESNNDESNKDKE